MVIRLLRAVLDIVVLLEGCPRQPSLGESEVEQAEEMVFLLEQLAALAEGINNDDWERRLAAELPGFPFELSWVQLMILNCRLFGLSRIRNPTYPMSLIRIHDFVFRSWQRSHLRHGPKAEVVTAVRYLDLESQTLQSLAEPPPRKEGHMRFVVISDTHGWSVAMPCGDGRGRGREDLSFGRIILPEGDVLLHCGDLLNEGEVLQLMDDAGSNTKLAEELAHLKSVSCQRGSDGSSSDDAEGSPRRFKWVFIVGGNHDAPIFMLAANGKLTDMMGDSMVLLQSAADFEASNPLDRDVPRVVNSVAKSAGVRAKVVNGAVRILPDGSLSPPHESVDRGVVLAGSGLSLANNAWTANRAFQIQRHESWKLRSAAESLMTFRPDIVMTHGPPAGYSDEGKGDQQLREALDEPDCSVKLHLFGHAHSGGMGCDGRPWQIHGRDFPGRCFVNCALVTSLYMPIRLPIVFDWPMVAQDAPKVPAPPMTPTTTEVAEPVARFGACHGCALGTQ
jgi:Icc-related predicted phosphoesterase